MRGLVHCLLLLFLLLPCYAAGVYKWTDAQGNVHYGDRPPQGQAVQSMDVEQATPATPPAPDSAARRDKQQRLLDSFAEDRQRRAARREADRQQQADREQKCAQARQRLQKIRNAAFLYEKTADPDNPRILSQAERQAQTAQWQAQVGKWCD